jgi:hypothetical protein
MSKGLYANIHARRKAGKPARKPSSKLAPSKQDFIDSAKTAKNSKAAKKSAKKLKAVKKR